MFVLHNEALVKMWLNKYTIHFLRPESPFENAIIIESSF